MNSGRYLFIGFLFISSLFATEPGKPVTPNASSEAVSLLEYLYNISGNHILTGQHFKMI